MIMDRIISFVRLNIKIHRTRLSDFTFTFPLHALEKDMATHSSVLAWRIPGTGSLVGCSLWGHTESDTTEVTQQQQQLIVVTQYFLCFLAHRSTHCPGTDLPGASSVQPHTSLVYLPWLFLPCSCKWCRCNKDLVG